MFERFSDQARRVVVMAQEESRRLNHAYIGAEHILLGLLDVDDGVAQRALEVVGVSADELRRRVVGIVGTGESAQQGHIPFTSDAKKVLENSLREAVQLGHNYIGTEHILLGITREPESIACRALLELGVDPSRVRQTVMQLLTEGAAAEAAPLTLRLAQPAPVSAPRLERCSFCGRDLWDVRYFVAGANVAICEDCVSASRAEVEDATARDAGPGALHLPPRVSGEPPDQRATSEVVDAFDRAFGDPAPGEDARARPIEDVESLVPAIEEAGRRYPHAGPRSVVVTQIRFRAEGADVRFAVLGSPFEGQAIRDAGAWKVSRDTFCRVLTSGGIPCPPREV